MSCRISPYALAFQIGAIDQTMVRDRPEKGAIGMVAKGAGLTIF